MAAAVYAGARDKKLLLQHSTVHHSTVQYSALCKVRRPIYCYHNRPASRLRPCVRVCLCGGWEGSRQTDANIVISPHSFKKSTQNRINKSTFVSRGALSVSSCDPLLQVGSLSSTHIDHVDIWDYLMMIARSCLCSPKHPLNLHHVCYICHGVCTCTVLYL